MATIAATSVLAWATAATAAVGVYSAVQQKKARKDQKNANAQAEQRARQAQAEQETLALKEKKASSRKLRDEQARLIHGTSGRSGLLFGSELGITDDKQKKQTLG